MCRNHRGGNQTIKKQLNWRGCYSRETSSPDRVQPQYFMGQSFAWKDRQYLVVGSHLSHYRFLGSNYSNSPLCRPEILLHSYRFIQGQGKRCENCSGSATERISFCGSRRTSTKQGILVSYLCRSDLIFATSQTTKLGIEEKRAYQIHRDLQEISYPKGLQKNGQDCKEGGTDSHGHGRHKAQPACQNSTAG